MHGQHQRAAHQAVDTAISARLKQLSTLVHSQGHCFIWNSRQPHFKAVEHSFWERFLISYFLTHKQNKLLFLFKHPCMADPCKRGRTAVIAWKLEKASTKPRFAVWHLVASFISGWIVCFVWLLQAYGEQT